MTLSISKTTFMVICKTRQQENLTNIRKRVDEVHKYKHQRTIVNEEMVSSEKIKTRIGQVRSTFNKMKNALFLRDISLNT